MYPRLKPLVFIIAALSAHSAFAETTLDPVVVTASRQPMRASEVLADVTVIEREEIQNAGAATTISDLLARQPGIELTSRGGPGTQSSVMIRGANDNHALVLVDGVRIASASTGSASWGFIPLEQVERVEILRGSCSSLYGSDAIGGVVQIFTKRGSGPAQFYAEAGAGSWNTRSLGAGVSGGENGWRYNFQVAEKKSDGFSALRNPKNSNYNSDKDGFYNKSSSGSLSYAITPEHEIGASYLYSDGWNRYDGSPKTTDWKQAETVAGWNIFSRNRLTDNWQSTLKFGQSSDDGRQFANGNPTSSIRTEQTQYQWQNDIKLPIGMALFALERTEQKVNGSSYAKERAINAAQLGWTGNIDKHRFQVNARHDDNSQFGGRTTGSAAYGYQLTQTLRANISAGNAFRAPTFNDLYWPGAGNPDLKPEIAQNREAAIHYEVGNHHTSLTYYQNKVKNLVEWAPVGAGGLWIPANVAKAELEGWTLAYDGKLAGFYVNASLDLQDHRDTELNKLLRHRAKEAAKLAVSHDLGAWRFGVETQLSGQRYNDKNNTEAQRLAGYGLVNLLARYKVSKEWEVFARANNIFDKKYELVRDYATPGANLFVGVRYAPK